jgi:hypothetical protein
MSEPADIDPEKAARLAAETGEEWEALLSHPVADPFIRAFRIPRADECP